MLLKTFSWTIPGSGSRWLTSERYYICVEKPRVERLARLVGRESLHTVVESGGKFVFSNH